MMVYYVHDLTVDAVSFVLPRPYDRRLMIVSGPQGVGPLVEFLRGLQGRDLRRVVLAAINGDIVDLTCGGFGRAQRHGAHRVHSSAGSLYCTERALQRVVARFAHAVIGRARLLGLDCMDERSLRSLAHAVDMLDRMNHATPPPIPVAREYSDSTRH